MSLDLGLNALAASYTLLHRTTGLLCPGCGSLRALHQLLHGHWETAFRFNPLLVASLPFAAWLAWTFLARKAKQQPFIIHLGWVWLLLGLAAAFTIWRNVPGLPLAGLPD